MPDWLDGIINSLPDTNPNSGGQLVNDVLAYLDAYEATGKTLPSLPTPPVDYIDPGQLGMAGFLLSLGGQSNTDYTQQQKDQIAALAAENQQRLDRQLADQDNDIMNQFFQSQQQTLGPSPSQPNIPSNQQPPNPDQQAPFFPGQPPNPPDISSPTVTNNYYPPPIITNQEPPGTPTYQYPIGGPTITTGYGYGSGSDSGAADPHDSGSGSGSEDEES